MPQFAFNVQFDVKAIRALPAGDYALPVSISSTEVTVNPETGRMLLGISVR